MMPAKPECRETQDNLALLLYGELSFDQEERIESHVASCAECKAALAEQKSLHAAFDSAALPEPPADLLWQCRTQLQRSLREQPPLPWWKQILSSLQAITWVRPVGALGMLAIGFFIARAMDFRNAAIAVTDPGAAKVRYVEAGTNGEVRIVLDETRQRTVSGRLDDQSIRSLLLNAVKDQADPGLRVQSIGMLNNNAQSSEVRDALLYALSHDTNDGVRMKALEGLKTFARDPEVRTALTQSLLHDSNAGLRAQAVDLLTEGGSRGMDAGVVGALQELLSSEGNAYVRERSQSALHAVKASAEIY